MNWQVHNLPWSPPSSNYDWSPPSTPRTFKESKADRSNSTSWTTSRAASSSGKSGVTASRAEKAASNRLPPRPSWQRPSSAPVARSHPTPEPALNQGAGWSEVQNPVFSKCPKIGRAKAGALYQHYVMNWPKMDHTHQQYPTKVSMVDSKFLERPVVGMTVGSLIKRGQDAADARDVFSGDAFNTSYIMQRRLLGQRKVRRPMPTSGAQQDMHLLISQEIQADSEPVTAPITRPSSTRSTQRISTHSRIVIGKDLSAKEAKSISEDGVIFTRVEREAQKLRSRALRYGLDGYCLARNETE